MDPIETYSVKQTGDLIGKAPNTVRTWTGPDLFGPYLSEHANPPEGEERRFTEGDIRRLRTAVILQSQGLKLSEIVPRIAGGELLELPEGEPLPGLGNKSGPRVEEAEIPQDRALVPPALSEMMLLMLRPYESQIDRLSREIDKERETRREAEREIDKERQARIEAEKENSRLSAKLEERDRPWYKRLFGG